MHEFQRIAAVAWLLVIAPIELATTLAGLLSGPADLAMAGIALILSRVLTTAGGLMLGRHLLQRGVGARPWALTWAAADLGTLGLVLASAQLPSNRAPGDAWIVWLAYAAAAAVVIVATRETRGGQAPPPP